MQCCTKVSAIYVIVIDRNRVVRFRAMGGPLIFKISDIDHSI